MKTIITGRVIAIDHTRQGFTIKPDKAQPLRVYADEKVFAKLANKIEADRLAGHSETRGSFVVSGRVLNRFKTAGSKILDDYLLAAKVWLEGSNHLK